MLILITGCDNSASTAGKSKQSRPLPAVEVTTAEIKPLSRTIVTTGTLEPNKSVRIFNQVQGLLTELPYYRGDTVNQGTVLAKLDDTIIRAEYDKAKTTLNQSRLDYGRLEKLAPTNLTSKELLTRSRSKVQLDRADFQLQEKRLSYMKIKAPITGVISERLAEPGDVLPIHTHFMSLMDVSQLKVKVSISELYLPLISSNSEVSFSIDALGKQQYSGKVIRIYPKINAQTRKGVIELSLAPVPDGALPGQLARITITTPVLDVLVIPIASIRYDQQGAYVYKVNDENIINRSEIVTGKTFSQFIEVLSGLETGDRVVQKGLFGLRNGKKVKIIDAQ